MSGYNSGYAAERARLDARKNCKTGYACGSTCIPLAKECRVNDVASIGRERLARIRQLAAGEVDEGRGLMRLRRGEAGALADRIQGERDKVAQTVRRLRQLNREANPPEPERPVKPAQEQGDRPIPGSKLAELALGQGARAEAAQKLVADVMDSLQEAGGEVGRNARQMAQILEGQQIALIFSRPLGKQKGAAEFLRSPALLRSLERGIEIAAERRDYFALDYMSRMKKDLEAAAADPTKRFAYRDRKGIERVGTIADKVRSLFHTPGNWLGMANEALNHVSLNDDQLAYLTGDRLRSNRFQVVAASRGIAEALMTRAGLNADGYTLDRKEARRYQKQAEEEGLLGNGGEQPTRVRGLKALTLGDAIVSDIPTRSPGDSWEDSQATAGYHQAAMTLIHEIGHMIHFRGTDPRVGPPVNKPAGHTGVPRAVEAEGGVSNYATQTPQERFAEAYSAYVLNPVALKRTFPETYKWVKEIADRAAAN